MIRAPELRLVGFSVHHANYRNYGSSGMWHALAKAVLPARRTQRVKFTSSYHTNIKKWTFMNKIGSKVLKGLFCYKRKRFSRKPKNDCILVYWCLSLEVWKRKWLHFSYKCFSLEIWRKKNLIIIKVRASLYLYSLTIILSYSFNNKTLSLIYHGIVVSFALHHFILMCYAVYKNDIQ